MSEPNTADRLNREQLAMQAVEEALLQPEPEQRHWLAAQVMAPPIKQRALDLYDQLSGDDPSADLSKQLLQDAVELTGTTVGDYHLDRLLGRGGMGSVYLAHREHEGVRQQVALKVLNHGLAPINAQRFRIEQQALARLHHPYIAGFVDVGTSASGLNYFAMEYVEGQELCTYADEQNLSLNARIHLWLKLCDAVRSSHQKLIIHRDIKPSNVLVTDDGVPKLVDFGVAKIMEGSEPSMTAALGAQLTLDYASPERIMHGETSTAEDQYALAVLLYELLAGHRPFIRSAHNMTQLLRQVADEDARPDE